MWKPIAPCALVVGLSVIAHPLVAHAQWSPSATANLGAGYGSMALSQSILSGTRRLGHNGANGSDDHTQNEHPQWRVQPEGAPAGSTPNGMAARHGQQTVAYPSQARVDALWQQLKPEYEQRVRLDGQASADQWLLATAREIGRRDGARARQTP